MIAALGLLGLIGCGQEELLRPSPNPPSPPPPPPPAPAQPTMAIVSGDHQQGQSGDMMPAPFTVILRDGSGHPASARWVRWIVISGAGDFGAASPQVETGIDGRAAIRFRPVGPGEHKIRAEVIGMESLSVTFTAQATGAAVLPIAFGPMFDCTPPNDPTQFVVGQGPYPFGVAVEWKYMDWVHPSCTARIRSVSVPNGGTPFDSGIMHPGEKVTVRLEGQGDWVFEDVINGGRVTIRVAGANQLVARSQGNFQQGISGQTMPEPLGVYVWAYSGVLPPFQVTWRVVSGAGEFSTPQQMHHGSSGSARVSFRPLSIGTITVAADLMGTQGSPVLFTLHAIGAAPPPPPPVPGQPAVAMLTGSGQTGVTTEYFPEPLVVRVTDAQGHGVQGVTVFWKVDGGAGEFSVRNQGTVTGADGVTMIAFRPHQPGPILVNARAEGFQGSGATFSLTATGPRIALIHFGPNWDCSGMDDPPTSIFPLNQSPLPSGSVIEWVYQWNLAVGCWARIRSVSVPGGGQPFDSGLLEPGQRFVTQLFAAGTWTFEDARNGGRGSLVVVP